MSDTLSGRVGAFLRARGLLRPDALILVAVSGGPDSLCLLHLLTGLRPAGGPALHVAHLDHGTRGAQSRAEADAVAALAAAWGLPASVARRDVPALARAGGEGLQAAARRARYAFLAEAALAAGAHAVATAHHADDQAETVLLHALRGAGLAGLRGMRPSVPWAEWGGAGAQAPRAAPALLRPLLTTARAEVEAYCRAHGLTPTEDPSNSARRFARVRVRGLLPTLAAENPRVVAALGRTAAVCADDYDFIQGQLDAAWPALAAAEAADASVLRREAWAALHPALQRYALRRAAGRLGATDLSLDQIEAARALAAHPGRHMRLAPRLWLEVDQQTLTLARVAAAAEGHRPAARPPGPAGAPQLAGDELPLAWPGATALGGGWVCVVQHEPPAQAGPWWVALDAEALGGPATLRRKRPGERFRPAGGRGSRKLQDFFVDHKLPQRLRAAWPILSAGGAVAWVCGLRADARFRAGAATQSTIWVGFIHHEGSSDAS